VGAHRQHVLEVRRTLEVGAAQLAAQRRTDADITRLRTLIATRNQASAQGDIDAAAVGDTELHRAIGQAAHNPILTDLYENFLGALAESVQSNFAATRQIDPNEHVDLVEAIAAGDVEAAANEAACYLDVLLRDQA
jgi:DNA-binding FadR family transcriptional regulator